MLLPWARRKLCPGIGGHGLPDTGEGTPPVPDKPLVTFAAHRDNARVIGAGGVDEQARIARFSVTVGVFGHGNGERHRRGIVILRCGAFEVRLADVLAFAIEHAIDDEAFIDVGQGLGAFESVEHGIANVATEWPGADRNDIERGSLKGAVKVKVWQSAKLFDGLWQTRDNDIQETLRSW